MSLKRIVAICLWLSLGVALGYFTWLGAHKSYVLLIPTYFTVGLSILYHGFSTAFVVALLLPVLDYMALRPFDLSLMLIHTLELTIFALFLSLLFHRMGIRKSIFFAFSLSWWVSRFVQYTVLNSWEFREILVFLVGLLLNILLLPKVKRLLVKLGETERRSCG